MCIPRFDVNLQEILFKMVFLKRILYFISNYKFTLLAAIVIVLSVFVWQFDEKKNHKQLSAKRSIKIIDCNRELYATAPIESHRKLNDNNDLQLLHAQANGLKNIYISNQAFEEDSAKLVEQHQLIGLKDNPLYHLKDLTHSYPYTTPEMAKLLNDIGLLFQEKMRKKNKDHFRLLVSSALRTHESQGSLSSRNRNAHTQSTHLYGATIDITYKEYFNILADSLEQNAYAADALRETMLDMREQCRLVVVRERRQACYHFTVVNCDPGRVPKDSISVHPLVMH